MTIRRPITFLLPLLLAACATVQPSRIPPPPPTEARPVTEILHGVEVTDPYRWLEDQNSPETRAWIDKQNAYTDQVLADLPAKERFARRIRELLETDQVGVPEYRSGRYFFTKRPAGADLDAIYVRENGNERLLIDPTPWSADHTVTAGIRDVSDDGKLVAYHVRNGGADEVEVRFLDVDTKRDLGTPLPRARYYGITLSPDRILYYTRMTQAGPRTYRRPLDGGAEELLFGEGYGREKIVNSALSDDGRYLLVHVLHGSAATKTEIYLKDLLSGEPMRTVQNDVEARSTAFFAGENLVIRTNWNAPNQRVFVAPIANPGRGNWRELVPENRTAAIDDVAVAGGRILVLYLENVRPRVVSYDASGTKQSEVTFDTFGKIDELQGSWSSPVAFFRFGSFHVSPTIYEYDVAANERRVFAQITTPVNPDDFTVEQVWFPSTDGARVPMFVFYKKGLQRNGTNPTYLTGYGGFTQAQLPGFSARAIAWAEMGGVYALPGLRGGSEFGEAWHRAGMLEQKQHTFDDFIAAAEYLIRERYTSSQHLGVAGRSNGGLLVMALATQRPDLAEAVVCGYPLIDMLRYHKFLVGSFWVPEYGSADNPAQFPFLYAYSPYHRVVKGTKYPAIYFYSGDADTRVAPLHARKGAALMQAMNGGDEPIVLRYRVSGGHATGEPLSATVEHESEVLGFLWWQLR